MTCPCCYALNWLIDAKASAQNAGDVIEQHIARALKDIVGVFR